MGDSDSHSLIGAPLKFAPTGPARIRLTQGEAWPLGQPNHCALPVCHHAIGGLEMSVAWRGFGYGQGWIPSSAETCYKRADLRPVASGRREHRDLKSLTVDAVQEIYLRTYIRVYTRTRARTHTAGIGGAQAPVALDAVAFLTPRA